MRKLVGTPFPYLTERDISIHPRVDFHVVVETTLSCSKKIEVGTFFLGGDIKKQVIMLIWLVVSTHLKNISQNGNLAQIGVKSKGC